MVDLGFSRLDAGFSISEPTEKVLSDFQHVVSRSVSNAIQAVSQNNQNAAQLVIDMKQEIINLVNSATEHQAERLVAEEPNRIAAYTIEVDIMEKQRRIYSFAKSMAKSVIPDE
jgi:phosphate:Na+ symporter